MNDDKVIHLNFKSPKVADDMMAFLGCKHCHNKTFTLTTDRPNFFPLVRCAACGDHIGRIGWYHEDKSDGV